MPLLTPDGKPYRAAGTLQQFDPDDTQHILFNIWDEDAIRQGGSPIYYYEKHISPSMIDPDYIEARGALVSEKGIELWANYEPLAAQNAMGAFGFDSLNEVVFECNARAVTRAIGHMPKIGSRIHTPHLGEDWEIIQRNLGEFKMWGALRVQLIARQWQESVTMQAGRATQNKPNIKRALS
jgi:hypothetical protein